MNRVQVAVGVIERQGRYLIAKRPSHVHQGGLWEFPGGKVEAGENVKLALGRELFEELGIVADVELLEPLINIRHDYRDKSVELDVWRVLAFSGEAHGREGQEIRWATLGDLTSLEFPKANKPIVSSLRLPDSYLFTGAFTSPTECLSHLQRILESRSLGMVRLRIEDKALVDYPRLGLKFVSLCRESGVISMLDWYEDVNASGADGVHFTSAQLREIARSDAGPIVQSYHLLSKSSAWKAFSCHSLEEVGLAQSLQADFITLSPLKQTKSHPGVTPLGWRSFANIVTGAQIPVYALGGVSEDDVPTAKAYGAQGVAGIRGWW